MSLAYELINVFDYVNAAEVIYGAIVQMIREIWIERANICPDSHNANFALMKIMKDWSTSKIMFEQNWKKVQE